MIKELPSGVVGVEGPREQQAGPDQNEQGEPAGLTPGRPGRQASSEGDDDGESFRYKSGTPRSGSPEWVIIDRYCAVNNPTRACSLHLPMS